MIIRPGRSTQLLITQPDHAALAGRIMRHWTADGFSESPRRSEILLAIDEHDNGWKDVDAVPIADAATGRLLDFVHAPDDVRRGVWPTGVDRLAATPYAAALVAQHALHIHGRYRTNLDWLPFFAQMEAVRGCHLRATSSLTLAELLRDYLFLRIGDLASLTFCNGWTDVQTDDAGHAVRLDGGCLVITPDPFGGKSVPIQVSGLELPDRPFSSPADARQAVRVAQTRVVTGIVRGAAGSTL